MFLMPWQRDFFHNYFVKPLSILSIQFMDKIHAKSKKLAPELILINLMQVNGAKLIPQV